MPWFERYGIPGTYFVALVAVWIYDFFNHIPKDDLLVPIVISLIAISLSMGYIISTIGQSVYLNWRNRLWGCPRVRGWLGFHGAALDRLDPKNTQRDEAVIEALSAHHMGLPENRLSFKGLEYTRDWIRRRMDIWAIDLSLIVGTILGFVILGISGFIMWPPVNWTLLIINIFIVSVIICNMITIRRQIVEILSQHFRATGFVGWVVDKEQAWFWTKRWQEGEREAEEDIRAGRIHSFDSVKESLAFLHKRAKKGSGTTSKA